MTGTRIHPWRRMRNLGPTWRLEWSDHLPDGVFGFTRWSTRTIHMRAGMTFEERRCTILHEVTHVERGPFSRCHELAEETTINRQCARLLVPSMQDLADALVFHHGEYEDAARDLWVDPWTLEVRLSTLRGLERNYLEKRLDEVSLLRVDG